MRRPTARLAAACALAVAMMTLTGSAVADGGHDQGDGNHAKSQQTQSSDTQGKKPDSHTDHWTNTSVGANPDVSKRYGNGKTAAEIAKDRGAPDNQPLKGPGNSQPHKTFDCKHRDNNSGGVDVHAIKSYSSNGCTTEQQKPEEQQQKPEEQKPAEQQQAETHVKVTICHATGSATNPFVEITVDEHALKNGHTAAKGDIIPAPASGCPTAAAPQVQAATAACSKDDDQGKASEEHGKSEDHAKAEDNDQDEAAECTTSAPAPAVVTPQANAQAPAVVTPAAPATPVTPAATTTTAAVPSTPAPQVSTTAASTGNVLGAQTVLAKPKAHHGVLGAVANIAGSSLPFTGFPVWLAVLIAAMLILAGIAVRRRTLGGGRL